MSIQVPGHGMQTSGSGLRDFPCFHHTAMDQNHSKPISNISLPFLGRIRPPKVPSLFRVAGCQ